MEKTLLSEIRKCQICVAHLVHGVNPVLTFSASSKIAIIGQAPGSVVHKTGIPWDDQSGNRLRQWLGVENEQFYDTDSFALIPMGFCYPGKGKSGDLPPRPECAPAWHKRIFDNLQSLSLKILIGNYAIEYYLKQNKKSTLTETVKNFKAYLPHQIVLPHPSPRNNIWMKKNEWFEAEVIPELKQIVNQILNPA